MRQPAPVRSVLVSVCCLLSFGWFVLQIYSFFFIAATDLGQKHSCGGVFLRCGQMDFAPWLAGSAQSFGGLPGVLINVKCGRFSLLA